MGYSVLDDRNLRKAFFQAYSEAEAKSWIKQLAMDVESDSSEETYRWLGAMPGMREWKGGRLEQGIRDELYIVHNLPFEVTLPVLLEDIRRDKTGMLKIRIAELGVVAGATHWEKLLTTLLLNGATNLCYDGKAYFSATHVSGESGTQKNLLTKTEVPSADVVLKTAPTAAEMAAIIMETIQHLYTLKDDQGEPINQNAKKFVVMVPIPFMAHTQQALSLQFLGAGISNPILGNNFQITALPNARLTWTDSFAMFRSDGRMKPLIAQEEVPIQTQTLGTGSEDEFHNRRHVFGAWSSRNAGYGLWQMAAKVTLSTAT